MEGCMDVVHVLIVGVVGVEGVEIRRARELTEGIVIACGWFKNNFMKNNHIYSYVALKNSNLTIIIRIESKTHLPLNKDMPVRLYFCQTFVFSTVPMQSLYYSSIVYTL